MRSSPRTSASPPDPSRRDASPLIFAEDLHVALGDKPILHALAFTVNAGTLTGLLGPNGSGKTTLLRTIGGVLPYAGTLHLAGRPVRSWKPRALARRVAFVRQSPYLAFDFTVEELVRLGRAPHKGWLEEYGAQDLERVRQALARVDLEGFARRSTLSLSGGELQRSFLAQALVQDADLLLLDEPTAHLDVHYQFEFMNLVHELVRQGRTAVAVFHDLALAARYADQLLVLQQGRLVAGGSPPDVLTPALIADVFRIKTEVETTPDGVLRIHYLGVEGSRFKV